MNIFGRPEADHVSLFFLVAFVFFWPEGGTFHGEGAFVFFCASPVCFSGPVCFFGGREAHFPGRGLDGKTARIKKAACGRCGTPPDHQKSIRFITIIDMVDSPCTNPYKTCRLRSLLEPFLQKGIQKYQKSIRFTSKS